MNNSDTAPLLTNPEKLFSFFLLFYPEQYRKKYGIEMMLLFQNMYQEELTKRGSIGIVFWYSQVGDITKSVIDQHIDLIAKHGINKYLRNTFHINIFNVIGSILLLPFFVLLTIDLISRILQGDLFHYNRQVYLFLSHTPFLSFPLQFIWIILFPLLAVIINLVPLLLKKYNKHSQILSLSFITQNIGSIVILGVGLIILAIIKGHDFAPCMLRGLVSQGVSYIWHTFSVCQNA